MNKKTLILISAPILATFSFFIFLTFGDEIFRAESNVAATNKEFDIIFADNYISYVIDEGTTMSFNIFGVHKIEKESPSFSDAIMDVSFNNENIDIIDFSLDTGLIKDEYQLFNFIIEVQVNGDNLEKSKELTLYLENQEPKSYNIGEVILKNNLNYTNGDISLGDNYTVGYPTPSLEYNLINDTESEIELNSVEDIAHNLYFEFKPPLIFKAKETRDLSIPAFNLKKNYDFYTVTPVASYSLGDSNYLFYMPGVIFGILKSDEEKIQMIIEK